MHRTKWTPERYQAWRATIQFSDEQIATAIEAEANATPDEFLANRYRRIAALARRGRIMKQALRLALPRLVASCAICGKTALYRYGTSGRCKAHRDVMSKHVQQRRDRFDRAGVAWADARRVWDYIGLGGVGNKQVKNLADHKSR